MTCKRIGCPFSHKFKEFSPYQQYCCNACAHNEQFHTKNCNGAGKLVQGCANWKTFTIPWSWMRGHFAVTDVVEWSCKSDYLELDARSFSQLLTEWKSFGDFIGNQKQCDTLQREIHLIAVTSREYDDYANTSDNEKNWDDAIDLTTYADIDARKGHYIMKTVTGVHSCVQSCLMKQNAVIDVLWDAADRIIGNKKIARFAFVCEKATHRSVACCLLLAILVFPRAHILLTTDRTQNAAIECGLIGVDA